MISLVLPLVFLCMNSTQKLLLSIIFCPFIVMDLCFWYTFQTFFKFIDDLLLKPFIDLPPEKIESYNDEDITRGRIFIDKLMGYWQRRTSVINERFRLGFQNLFYEASMSSCPATITQGFTREGNSLLREENERILIKARLKDGDIVIEGPVLLNFMNYKKMFDSYIRIQHITAYVEFDFDRRGMKNGNLIDVKIERIKNFFVYFRKGSVLNHFLSVASTNFLNINYYVTRRIVQKFVKKYLSSNFDQFEFFVDKLGPTTSSGGHSSESEVTLTSSEVSDHEFSSLMTEESSHSE